MILMSSVYWPYRYSRDRPFHSLRSPTPALMISAIVFTKIYHKLRRKNSA